MKEYAVVYCCPACFALIEAESPEDALRQFDEAKQGRELFRYDLAPCDVVQVREKKVGGVMVFPVLANGSPGTGTFRARRKKEAATGRSE